jgi:type I restriction enzyme S subunit
VSAAASATLGEVADLLVGNAFKSDGFLNEDEDGISILRGENVGQGSLKWAGKTKRWREDDLPEVARYELQMSDVILAMDRPIVGDGLKYAWITEADLPCLLVQRVCRIRGRAGKALTGYLRYVIGSPAFTEHIHGITTGANIPHISGKDISAFSFPLPSLTEQEKIVEALAPYDELVNNNEKQIALLEEAARLIYTEWFIRLRFPRSSTSISTNWHPATLEEAVSINPKTLCEAGKEAPFVPMTALSQTGMVIEGIEQRAIGGGAKFQNGDTLLARITPCLENGKTGFVQFLDDENPVASGSTEFIVLRSRRVNPYWIYCLARTEHFREYAIRSMSGADGRQRVSTDSLAQYPVTIPPAEILEKFEQAVGPMFEQIHTLTQQIAQLRQARDLLLPRLISGQLRL